MIDGQRFDDPTFEDFLPHINALNLGGEHIGVNVHDRTTVYENEDHSSQHYAVGKQIVLQEIQELIKKKYPP